MTRLSISVIGLGYVGLSTAVCFAKRGIRVHGLDVDEKKLRLIGSGKPPFHEKRLDSMLGLALKDSLLSLSSDYNDAVGTDVTFIAVGTPSAASGEINLNFVESAVRQLGEVLKTKRGFHVVVVKSTVIPGTTIGRVLPLLSNQSGKTLGKEFGLAVNPEFLREGSAVVDTMKPDALVIGAADRRSSLLLTRLFRQFYQKMPPTIMTSPSNAELIKYSINTFRAIQLSTINSLADICSQIYGADMDDVARGLSLIGRVDDRYVRAGLGYGGSCLPKDTRALVAFSEGLSAPSAMFRAALEVNKQQPGRALELAKSLLGDLRGKKVAVLGLAFKAGTDDVRESAAVDLCRLLCQQGAIVSVFDPAAMDNARSELGGLVTYTSSGSECLDGADCCILATEWEEFRALRPSTFKKLMRQAVVVDGRRVYDAVRFKRAGVRFAKIGTSIE